MAFTPEHDELRRSLQKFIAAEINPHVDQWEEDEIFPAHEVFKKMGDLGFLGLTKPVGLWRARARLFLRHGDGRRARQHHLRQRADGDRRADRHGDAGARPLRLRRGQARIPGAVDRRRLRRLPRRLRSRRRLRRRLDQDHGAQGRRRDYVINGGKMWTTNGTQADWMCLLANTSDGPVHRNKSLICLPMKTKGVQIARKLDKLGMRSSDTAQIFFDDVRVPQRYLIGEEGKGFIYQMLQFQEERLWGAAAMPEIVWSG